MSRAIDQPVTRISCVADNSEQTPVGRTSKASLERCSYEDRTYKALEYRQALQFQMYARIGRVVIPISHVIIRYAVSARARLRALRIYKLMWSIPNVGRHVDCARWVGSDSVVRLSIWIGNTLELAASFRVKEGLGR